MRRPLFFFLAFLGPLVWGVHLNRLNIEREVFRSICDLTQGHFYRDDQSLKKWIQQCHEQAAQLPVLISVPQLLVQIQDLMNEMRVSHFQIYNPDEDRQMWKGEAVDTGIRSRFVEDHLLVYRVWSGSAAHSAGVRVGDEILHIEGAEQLTPWGAEHRSGEFQLLREKKISTVKIAARTLKLDQGPRLTDLGAHTGLLEVQSFRAEFFEQRAWQALAAKMTGYAHVIVDLRENSGGNFVALLRGLSPFLCDGQTIGEIVQPRSRQPSKIAFADDIHDDFQLAELDRFSRIGLRTFRKYGCFRGVVTVLVGPDTSSVAEIFAETVRERPRTRIWGQPTAGDVVLAVWYDLPALGAGYSVSIPEAMFLTPDHRSLEGQGVWPERELHYDLEVERSGRDSWIEASRH